MLAPACLLAVSAWLASPLGEMSRGDDDPAGLSGITHAGGARYYAVNDRGGELAEYELTLSPTNDALTAFTLKRRIKLAGCVDLEGCAADPLRPHVVWVTDEVDTSIRGFDVRTGQEVGRVPVPSEVRRGVRPNRSLEALAIAPDGLTLWTANEDTLTCDGDVASRGKGGHVRLVEFTRTGATAKWTLARQLMYDTEPVAGDKPMNNVPAISGVADLAVAPDGMLLVLEREFSRKNPLFPTFRLKIFAIDPTKGSRTKALVFEENTFTANYEGLCLGPKLRNGNPTLVLVTDGDGGADTVVRVLSLSRSSQGAKP